ncbi:spermidine synthase, partial [Effusibacillus lacus]|uniref:spermidine synthase n=1 Tax=Effusibacillus lacus TaxID=1348429 RepID=UPI00350E4F68
GAFLESSRDRYDLIFLDAYDSYSIPKSMRSVECMQQARNLLEENGLLIVNVIGRISGPESGFFRSFYKTIREVFSEVWVLPVTRWTRMEQNILLIARRSVGTQMHPDSKGDKELEKLLRRLYLRTIPTSDVPVCRDTE